MSFQLTQESTFVRLAFWDLVVPQDLYSAMRELEALEARVSPVPNRLIDLSGLTDSDVTGEDVHAVAERRLARRFPNRFKSALVASRPAQVGYARMFQMFNDHPDITLEVFASSELAIRWLDSPTGK